jgi:exonuclease III
MSGSIERHAVANRDCAEARRGRKGMRLDHFLLSPKVSDRLLDGGVDRWARGQLNASDHVPTWIMLDL